MPCVLTGEYVTETNAKEKMVGNEISNPNNIHHLIMFTTIQQEKTYYGKTLKKHAIKNTLKI